MLRGHGGFAAASRPSDLESKVELSQMREMNPAPDNNDVRLHQALRSLAASMPADAPSEMGEALAGVFRRRHFRRRAIYRTAMAIAVLALLLPATVFVRKHPSPPAVVGTPHPRTVAPPVTTTALVTASSNPSSEHHAKALRRLSSRAHKAHPVNEFVALPSSDQVVRGEELQVIRLELTGGALRMLGAPVSEDITDRRLLADFVVGQDGTPYAVRLVR
jgi:hypothetical protein